MSIAFTIGRLAAAAGVHVETVRYYQRRELLPDPPRPLGGVRRYAEADLVRLQFIRRAQAMGFSLDEVASLLAVKGAGACDLTRNLTENKLADVRRKLDELHRLESELVQLVAECEQTLSDECYPTLDRLEHAGEGAEHARPTLPLPLRKARQRTPSRLPRATDA